MPSAAKPKDKHQTGHDQPAADLNTTGTDPEAEAAAVEAIFVVAPSDELLHVCSDPAVNNEHEMVHRSSLSESEKPIQSVQGEQQHCPESSAGTAEDAAQQDEESTTDGEDIKQRGNDDDDYQEDKIVGLEIDAITFQDDPPDDHQQESLDVNGQHLSESAINPQTECRPSNCPTDEEDAPDQEGQLNKSTPYLCQERYENETDGTGGGGAPPQEETSQIGGEKSDPWNESRYEATDILVDDAFDQIYKEEDDEWMDDDLEKEMGPNNERGEREVPVFGVRESATRLADLSPYGQDCPEMDCNDNDDQDSWMLLGNRNGSESLKKEQGSNYDASYLDKAATKIQAGYRGFRQRQMLKNRKNETQLNQTKLLQLQNSAATKIQAGFRGHRERKNLKRSNKVKQGHCATTDDDQENKDPSIEEEDCRPETERQQHLAATKIQASFRGFRVRRQIKCHVPISKSENDDDESTPLIIDDEYDPDEELRKHLAATKIQANYRGFRTRNKLKHRLDEAERQQQHLAATKIQATYRGFRDRKKLKNGLTKKNNNDDVSCQEDRLNAAATKIQATYRGFQCRKKKKANLLMTARHQEELDRKMNAAAAKIQAGYRGFRVRKALKKQSSMNRREIKNKPRPIWLSKHRGLPQSRRGSLPEDRRLTLLREQFLRRGSDSTLLNKTNRVANDEDEKSEQS